MMAAELGPFGCVARVGGEEFALLSSGVSLEALASQLIAFCEGWDRRRFSSTVCP